VRSRPACPRNSQWAPPTTNDDKDQLQTEYGTLFDTVVVLKDAVASADEDTQKKAGIAFDRGLVRSFFCSDPFIMTL